MSITNEQDPQALECLCTDSADSVYLTISIDQIQEGKLKATKDNCEIIVPLDM